MKKGEGEREEKKKTKTDKGQPSCRSACLRLDNGERHFLTETVGPLIALAGSLAPPHLIPNEPFIPSIR